MEKKKGWENKYENLSVVDGFVSVVAFVRPKNLKSLIVAPNAVLGGQQPFIQIISKRV